MSTSAAGCQRRRSRPAHASPRSRTPSDGCVPPWRATWTCTPTVCGWSSRTCGRCRCARAPRRSRCGETPTRRRPSWHRPRHGTPRHGASSIVRFARTPASWIASPALTPPDTSSPALADVLGVLRVGLRYRGLAHGRCPRVPARPADAHRRPAGGPLRGRRVARGRRHPRHPLHRRWARDRPDRPQVMLADSAGNDGGLAGETVYARGGPGALADALASAARSSARRDPHLRRGGRGSATRTAGPPAWPLRPARRSAPTSSWAGSIQNACCSAWWTRKRSVRSLAGRPATCASAGSPPRSTWPSPTLPAVPGPGRRRRPRRGFAAGSWSRRASRYLDRAADAAKYGRISARSPGWRRPSPAWSTRCWSTAPAGPASGTSCPCCCSRRRTGCARRRLGRASRRAGGPGDRTSRDGGAGHRRAGRGAPGADAAGPGARLRLHRRSSAPRRAVAGPVVRLATDAGLAHATGCRSTASTCAAAGAHPGGGVTGTPGRNAAREILADRRRRPA